MRQCYYISPSQNPDEYGGYVPSLVVENEPGHSPLVGDPAKHQAPWIWGQTLVEAETICNKLNAKHGLSELDQHKIVASSMRHSL